MVKPYRQHGPKTDLMETQIQVRAFDSALSPEEFQALPRMPVSVILEDLRSAFNVGSIIRTADCARIEKIVFCGYTAHPPHKKLEKTSLGALPYAKWDRRPTALEAVAGMKRAGIPVAALELTDRSQWI